MLNSLFDDNLYNVLGKLIVQYGILDTCRNWPVSNEKREKNL